MTRSFPPRAEARHRRSPPPPPDPEPGAGHGHGHGPVAPAGRRVRWLVAALLVPAVLATLVGVVLLHPTGTGPRTTPGAAAAPRIGGHVVAAAESGCEPGAGEPSDGGPEDGVGCATLVVQLTDGPRVGTVIETPVSLVRGRPPFGVGDDVVLALTGDPADPAAYQVVDAQRGTPLGVLAVLFTIAVALLGRWRGLAALAGLGLTGVVLVAFVLPAILAGRDPLAVAVVGSCAIMFGVLYLSHGFSARTSTAVLGTLLSLLLIAALGVAFGAAARLTGADEDTAILGNVLGADVDTRGLLLAGLVIGALGALDDVTVTQTSVVWELQQADPDRPARALFGAAMRVGRDHVGAAVNTLVLAYAGAALPVLLLFSAAGPGLGATLSTQTVATEVVRSLVGGIGLVASVPLTTAIAVAVVSRNRAPVR